MIASCYLQTSLVRDVLDYAVEQRALPLKEESFFQRECTFRLHLSGALAAGSAQAVHCLAVWIFASLATLFTLGTSETLETIVQRSGDLYLASLIGMGIALVGFFDSASVKKQTEHLTASADEAFRLELEEFVKGWDTDLAALIAQLQLRAARRQDPVCRQFFDPMVKKMRQLRVGFQSKYRKTYPKDNLKKHAFLVQFKALKRKVNGQQRRDLAAVPFTRFEIEQYFVQKACEDGDEALKEMYAYPLKVWAQRVKNWGDHWNRTTFCEQCLKIFRRSTLESRVKDLIHEVKCAENKEHAYKVYFEKDLSELVRKLKNEVDNVENHPWWQRLKWRFN